MKTVLIFDNNEMPSLNELLRAHWAVRKRMKDRLRLVLMSKTRNRYAGPVHITFHRYAVRLMDWDNFCGSFKLIGDALVQSGVIKDDKPAVIVRFTPLQTKVSKLADERVEIEIQGAVAAPDSVKFINLLNE